jgi:hypothetical protein
MTSAAIVHAMIRPRLGALSILKFDRNSAAIGLAATNSAAKIALMSIGRAQSIRLVLLVPFRRVFPISVHV